MGKRLKLFLITQTANRGYDTYDSAVVAAVDEEAACKIHPRGRVWTEKDEADSWSWTNTWARPEQVTATVLGRADASVKPGVVCASFNAG